MSAAAAATVTHTTLPSLTPLKVLPPAKEIPSTFVAGVKSWWEAGTNASAHAEERLLRYVSTTTTQMVIRGTSVPDPPHLGNSLTTAPHLLKPSKKCQISQ